MMVPVRAAILSLLPTFLVACVPPSGPPPDPRPSLADLDTAVVEPPLEPYPHPVVWTARPGIELASGGLVIELPHAFTALDVVERDTVGLRVVCGGCAEQVEGYVDEAAVVAMAREPAVAAWGELAEFALAVREAAARRDLDALRGVMAVDFTSGFVGVQTAESAISVWRAEQFAALDRVPALLDEGLASPDGRIWSAPPRFLTQIGYQGLRLGFRQRPDGRWEWIYLIRGIDGG